MRMATLHAQGSMRLPTRQRGWAGIVMILVALVIVAVLAKEALKGYGLAPGTAAATKAGTPAERARMPGSGEVLDMGAASSAPAAALERAHGVEAMMKRQAAEREARPDGATQ